MSTVKTPKKGLGKVLYLTHFLKNEGIPYFEFPLYSFVGGHHSKTNFRNEVSQTSGTNASQINQIQAQLAGLKLDYDKVSADLISTRNERDSTVSEMRQEIERLNLLHGDQR